MGIIHCSHVNSQWSDQSDHYTRICFHRWVTSKQSLQATPAFFLSHAPQATPLWSQFAGYCLTFWENACPHGQPSFSPTLCYCHHFICTQVTVLKPCPVSEFYTDKAPKICNPLIKLMYVRSSSLLIKLEFRHTGFVYEAISILHRWQKKMILYLPRKKLTSKMVMILLILALPIRSNSLTWLYCLNWHLQIIVTYSISMPKWHCSLYDCSIFFNKRFFKYDFRKT